MSLWQRFMSWIDGPLPDPWAIPVNKMPDPRALSELEVVARTLWGEARGEGYLGMYAVVSVIGMREKLRWGGSDSFKEVCLAYKQFSCWNADNVNRAKMLVVGIKDAEYRTALSIANSLITGGLKDITHGADSYEVRGTNAYWAKNLKPVSSIGKHDFYITRSAPKVPTNPA